MVERIAHNAPVLVIGLVVAGLGPWNFNQSAGTSYSGGTRINAGSTVFVSNNNTVFGTGPVTFGANSGNGSGYIRADFGPRTLANNFAVNGPLTFGFTGRHDLTLTGTLALGSGSSAMNLNVVGTGDDLAAT